MMTTIAPMMYRMEYTSATPDEDGSSGQDRERSVQAEQAKNHDDDDDGADDVQNRVHGSNSPCPFLKQEACHAQADAGFSSLTGSRL